MATRMLWLAIVLMLAILQSTFPSIFLVGLHPAVVHDFVLKYYERAFHA